MAFVERGITIKQSRISFFYNYVLIALTLLFFVLVWIDLKPTFTLFPQTPSQFSDGLVVLGFMLLLALLFEEPEIRRWMSKYIITNNELIKVEGIIRKKRVIIPYQSVADIDVYKSVLGRIFNFGNIEVAGFKNKIVMKGIRDPETFYRIINNKISIMRGTKQTVVTGEEIASEEKEAGTDWKKEQKSLEKKMKPLKKGKKGKGIEIFGLKILASNEQKEGKDEKPSKKGKKITKKRRKKKQKKR